MRRVIAVTSMVTVLMAASAAGAQPPKGATQDPHGHAGPAGSPSASTAAPTQTPGPSGHQMPMAMCMEMMRSGGMMGGGMMGHHGGTGGMEGQGGGMMGGPMMGMGMSGTAMDPKTMSQMMEMRGEMMKAMGDIMMKHAQRMRAADAPAKK
jgi:hypothetical protein